MEETLRWELAVGIASGSALPARIAAVQDYEKSVPEAGAPPLPGRDRRHQAKSAHQEKPFRRSPPGSRPEKMISWKKPARSPLFIQSGHRQTEAGVRQNLAQSGHRSTHELMSQCDDN